MAYASKAITIVEKKYNQTEREVLGVVCACEHLSSYLYGSPEFIVITDHEPLEKIWTKTKPTLRIKRWGLGLQPYNFKIVYRPRHLGEGSVSSGNEEKVAEYYVNFVYKTSVPKAMPLEKIM